jgi:hypothetical protein
MRMNIFGFQMAVKNFLKRNTINFLNYALILRRSVVEYNVFLFDKPLKGSKSLKIFKISLTFRFDKLSNLSKSVHTGKILTVSNKKIVI